jgi:hypothetical protein
MYCPGKPLALSQPGQGLSALRSAVARAKERGCSLLEKAQAKMVGSSFFDHLIGGIKIVDQLFMRLFLDRFFCIKQAYHNWLEQVFYFRPVFCYPIVNLWFLSR